MVDTANVDRGTAFLAVGWLFTGIALTAVLLRLYTRVLVTRSAGSDDLAIVLASVLTVIGEISDTIQVANGLGRHAQFLNDAQLAQVLKWEYVVWLTAFLSFFFIRSSVMLFTLRLLPAMKFWSQRIVAMAFALNFAITVIAVVTYGVRCVPFSAMYSPNPQARCESASTVVASQRLNGILACIVDIITASVPAFLLWKIQIKRTTKVTLNVIFFCGLATAALSIGRAAATNTGVYVVDNSWRVIPSAWFAMVEEKLGILLSCCPALRQLIAYAVRTHSIRPAPRESSGNQDIVTMRRKVLFRDLFWYRKPRQLSTLSGMPLYPAEGEMQPEVRQFVQEEAGNSPLDATFTKIRSLFRLNRSSRKHSTNDTDIEDAPPPQTRKRNLRTMSRQRIPDEKRPTSNQSGTDSPNVERNHGWPGLQYKQEHKRIARNYKAWGLPPNENEQNKAVQSSTSFFKFDSDESLETSQGRPNRSSNSLTPESSHIPRRRSSLTRGTLNSRRRSRQNSANSAKRSSERHLSNIAEQEPVQNQRQVSQASTAAGMEEAPASPVSEISNSDLQLEMTSRVEQQTYAPPPSSLHPAFQHGASVINEPVEEEQLSEDSGLGQSINSNSRSGSATKRPVHAKLNGPPDATEPES